MMRYLHGRKIRGQEMNGSGNGVKEVCMQKGKRKLLCLILTVALLLGIIPMHAFAADDPAAEEKNELRVAKLPGYDLTFGYNDEWFTESSFDYNQHLATLSILASSETRTKDNAKATLEAMGFEDVEGNGYYDLSYDKPQSIALMVGKKMIKVDGEEVPLIGIVVRGSGYSLEWYGNFVIGSGGVHEDFKQTADEAIRFVKNYAAKEGITGDTKIWVTGFSRAGAVADLIAGYYALNDNASVNGFSTSPENVYCYPMATANTVIEGKVTKGDILSVSAARTEADYKEDAPGEAVVYTGDDKDTVIAPDDPAFNGIHNLDPPVDLVPKLPPEIWNYTVLGKHEGQEYVRDQQSFLYYLGLLAGEEAVEAYKKYGGPENYKWMTFDLNNLSFVEDTSVTEPASQAKMFDERVNNLVRSAGGESVNYEKEYQEVLASAAEFAGTIMGNIGNEFSAEQGTLIKAGIFTYIAYVKEWYKEKKGVELSDGEAGEIVMAAVISMLTGETIDPKTLTIDDLLYYICRYTADNTEQNPNPQNPSSVSGYTYKTKLAEMIHQNLAKMINNMGGGSEESLSGTLTLVYSMFKNGAYGSEGSAETVHGKEDGKADRQNIYGMILMGLTDYPAVAEALSDNGSKRVYELLNATLPIVMTVEDEGGSSKTYATTEEAADAMLSGVLYNLRESLTAEGKIPATGFVADQLKKAIDTLAQNPGKIRRVVAGALLGNDSEEFDIPLQIRTASTFISQANAILNIHSPQSYAAWMMSEDDLYPIIQNSAKEGDYEEAVTAELSSTENVEMYYTLDGSDPTPQSEKYTAPITLSQTEERQEITLKVIGVRNGKAGRVWEYTYVVEAPVTYSVISGDNSEWKKGTEESISVTFKRSCNDEKTIDLFDGLTVDGKKVDESSYTKKAGSVILTLTPEFLETLGVGKHVLAASFTDADPAEASFTVLEKDKEEEEEQEDPGENEEEQGEPDGDPDESKDPSGKPSGKPSGDVRTGDDTPVLFFEILMIASFIAIGGILVLRKKNK